MHVVERIRHSWPLPMYFLILAMLLAIYSDTADTSNLSPTLTDGSGCPSTMVASDVAATASIIVSSIQTNQTILAHNGDVIEIRLPFGRKWTGPTASQGILQMLGPAGYAAQSDHACIWRFFIRGTGTTQLVFHSWALCPINQMCPMYIVEGAVPDIRVTFLISTISVK